MPADSLRIYRYVAPVSVLGPGARAIIWVQGCPRRCPGCITPDAQPADGGREIALAALADWVLAQPGIEGITFTGGEPMAQADGLCGLIDRLRTHADLGVVCYTGECWDELHRNGSEAQQALLTRIDLLIDGPYEEDRHAGLRWRGSTNQRLLLLSPRYASLRDDWQAQDASAGMQFFVEPDGALWYAGVPPIRRFREQFASNLTNHGITLITREEEDDEWIT